MKPAQAFLIVFILIAGYWIITTPSASEPKQSLASNPTPIVYILPTSISTPTPSITTEIQVLRATYGPPLGFDPVEFTVKAGIPARLEVLASENGRGCMGSLMVPDFSTQVEFFEKGKTSIIDFIPTTPGTYYITCAMGIPQATVFVK